MTPRTCKECGFFKEYDSGNISSSVSWYLSSSSDSSPDQEKPVKCMRVVSSGRFDMKGKLLYCINTVYYMYIF